jgi:hypothetical protein
VKTESFDIDSLMDDFETITGHDFDKGNFYMSRPIKRKRRSKADMERLKSGLYDILAEYHPQTVRGVFYQAVSRGLIEKTELEYQNAVQRNLVKMRESGQIPFSWITDNSRWMRKPTSYSNVYEALENAQYFYKKDLWENQTDYIEFWMEKETLSGIVHPVTAKYDIPLMVTHGFSSISFIYESAKNIESIDKPAFIYILSDYDKAGNDLSNHIENKLEQYAPDSAILCERIAVTAEQIEHWDLPTRPPKKRDKGFSECVELDAIPAPQLVNIVEQTILSHIAKKDYEQHLLVEDAEKESFESALALFDR